MKAYLTFLNASNDKTDPERAILPALIYTKMEDEIGRAIMISIGWWAWGIGIIFYYKIQTKNKQAQEILAEAQRRVEVMKKAGWTQQDFADALKELFEELNNEKDNNAS